MHFYRGAKKFKVNALIGLLGYLNLLPGFFVLAPTFTIIFQPTSGTLIDSLLCFSSASNIVLNAGTQKQYQSTDTGGTEVAEGLRKSILKVKQQQQGSGRRPAYRDLAARGHAPTASECWRYALAPRTLMKGVVIISESCKVPPKSDVLQPSAYPRSRVPACKSIKPIRPSRCSGYATHRRLARAAPSATPSRPPRSSTASSWRAAAARCATRASRPRPTSTSTCASPTSCGQASSRSRPSR